jgi:formate-dependent nitrite reductase membrane component NrfD
VPLATLERPTLTLAACGFVVAVASGVTLLSTNGSEYVGNPFLPLKFAAIGLGLSNIAAAQFLPAWRTRSAEPHGPRERFVLRVVGATSLVCWIGAVAAGRMIGYW